MKHTTEVAAPKKHRFDVKYALYSLFISGFLIAPLLYIDHRKDREQFVSVAWMPGNIVVDAAILTLIALAFAAALYLLLSHAPAFLHKHAQRDPWKALRLQFDRRSILLCATVIFVSWIPMMILMYPCSSNHDFINQIYQYQASAPTYYTTSGTVVDAEFIDHHPIFDTLIYGWFFSFGDKVLGSQNKGMFLFSVVQSGLIALILATCVCYLEKLSIPKCLRILAFIFAIFFIYHSAFAVSAMKDTLFVLGFTPFCLCYLEAWRTRGEILKNTKFLIAFILTFGLCILTKKLGVYICTASMLVMILFLARVRLRSLAVLVTPILVFSIAFPAIVYPAIGGVAPGGKQEAICFALQQTTTLLIEKPEAVSDEDLATIETVLDTDAAKENYKEALADGAKNRWRQEATTADEIAYLKVWAKEGIQNPKIYALSLVKCSGQMLIPSKQLFFPYDISDKDHRERWGENFSSVSEGYNMQLERPDSLLQAAKQVRAQFMNGFGKLPILGVVTTIGLYGSWIPFLCVIITFINRKREILALAPIMWSVCTLLISPGSLGRYVISLLFMIIPMVGWMLYSFYCRKGEQIPENSSADENEEAEVSTQDAKGAADVSARDVSAQSTKDTTEVSVQGASSQGVSTQKTTEKHATITANLHESPTPSLGA